MSYGSFLGLLSFIDMLLAPMASTLLSVCSALCGTFAPTTLKELCMLRIMHAHVVAEAVRFSVARHGGYLCVVL